MQVCTSLQTDNHASTPPLKNRDQLRNRTLGSRVRATFTFYMFWVHQLICPPHSLLLAPAQLPPRLVTPCTEARGRGGHRSARVSRGPCRVIALATIKSRSGERGGPIEAWWQAGGRTTEIRSDTDDAAVRTDLAGTSHGSRAIRQTDARRPCMQSWKRRAPRKDAQSSCSVEMCGRPHSGIVGRPSAQTEDSVPGRLKFSRIQYHVVKLYTE